MAVGLQAAQVEHANDLLRDGVFQRYKYTYELSWKMLKRYLEMTLPPPEEVDGTSFQTLIRTGSEQGCSFPVGTSGSIIGRLAYL
ncbi:hypothetical protein GMST_25640 [Geomonas silvestris]|uniref:Nucleotidyltransferase n=1 Tax=Geomonas silvestris TaxID=2740184 RepID=A0A6V8MKS3_9BACT|nr:hypothetical protein GMST_25640 [Geomonas silvestris]